MEQNWLSALWNRFFARDGEAAAQSQSNTTSGFPRQLPPAPRHVRASWRIRAAHLVLAVNMLCVVIMTGDFTWRLAFALSYLELSATITGGNCHHGHSLTYQYSFASRTFTGTDFVSKVICEDNLIAGQLTSVRYFSLGPFSGANLSLANRPWSADHMLFDIFYVIFGAFGNGLLWRADRRTMELVRSGHVAVGTVTDFYKTPRSRGVIYRFVNPISAEVIAARTEVYSMKLWRRTKKGQTVTVLYDPNTPERCTIYEFCGYSIVADSENCISSRA